MLSDDLRVLAAAYVKATGVSLSALSKESAKNERFLFRLMRSEGVNLKKAEGVFRWLSDNWPDGAAWPSQVGRPGQVKRSRVNGKGKP